MGMRMSVRKSGKAETVSVFRRQMQDVYGRPERLRSDTGRISRFQGEKGVRDGRCERP